MTAMEVWEIDRVVLTELYRADPESGLTLEEICMLPEFVPADVPSCCGRRLPGWVGGMRLALAVG